MTPNPNPNLVDAVTVERVEPLAPQHSITEQEKAAVAPTPATQR